MTFYWWSHWFWITYLNVQMPPNVMSDLQEISVDMASHQQQELRENLNKWAGAVHPTTELYQTTSNQSESETVRILGDVINSTIESLEPTTIVSTYASSALNDSAKAYVEGKMQLPLKAKQQYKVKRSSESVKETAAAVSVEKLSNYTNFSSSLSSAMKNNTTPSSTTFPLHKTSPTKQMFPSVAPAPLLLANKSSFVPPPSFKTNGANTPTPYKSKIGSDWQGIRSVDEQLHRASFTLENTNKDDYRSRKSKVLLVEYKPINRYINLSIETKSLLMRTASSNLVAYDRDESNISSEALAVQRTYFMDAGAVSAICITVFGICCTVSTIGVVLYRRRYLNKPQTLSEPDSSIYIDDSTMRVSDNSDEMYSLDNDSFLNSLEAITIQNYWTDTVKHTKL